MDRKVRRKDRTISEEEAKTLLEKGEYGVMASADEFGTPLATPLSYAVMNNAVYFHCALEGHKVENITARAEVCFVVVGKTMPVFVNDFSTYYESVAVHGKATVVADKEERRKALCALCEKYLPEYMDRAEENILRSEGRTLVVKISMDRVVGKAKRPKPLKHSSGEA